MTLTSFLVTVAVLVTIAVACWKKVGSLRAEIVQLVPWHDRWKIVKCKVLIACLTLAMVLCAIVLFSLCVYGALLWLAH